MSSNAQVLSSGSEVYAKKRKARQDQLAEVTFDPDARKEYLTGFHKRKVHRQNVAREIAKKKEHEEKLEARKEARAAKKEMQEEKVQEYEKYRRQLKIKYGEALSDEEDDETVFSDDDDSKKEAKEPKQSKFKTKTSLTTVTVIEDMDQDDGTFGLPKNNTATMEKKSKKKGQNGEDGDVEEEEAGDDGDDNGNDKKRQKIGSSSVTSARGAKKLHAPKEKTKKFRYEGKVQRKITALKDRQRGSRGPGGREERGGRGGERGGRGGGRGGRGGARGGGRGGGRGRR
ncbi:hypothetical protein BGZ58_008281 [Dissophora ornata]|nr:hypothetical protein BGZ58_008281 [Dissophora ornata]